MNEFVVMAIASLCILCALVIAIGPSRGLIGIGTAALTGCLGILSWYIFEMNAVFWLFPTFLIADLALVYLLSASEINEFNFSEKDDSAESVKAIFWLSIVLFVTFSTAYAVWMMPLENLNRVNYAFTETYKSLWTDNWFLALFCLLVLCPASFGALLMMRSKR